MKWMPVGFMAILFSAMWIGGCESSAMPKVVENNPSVAPMTEQANVAPVIKTVYADYGEALKQGDSGESISAAAVLRTPQEYNRKLIRVKGKVLATCDNKGCWFTVGDPSVNEVIFIKFQDPPEGRLIPLNAPGHDAVLEGEFIIGKMSESFARHLKEEAQAPESEIDRIIGPQKVYTIRNVAVRIYGVESTGQKAKQ